MEITGELVGVGTFGKECKVLNALVRSDMKSAMARAAAIIEARAKENLAGKHGHMRHWITGNLARCVMSKVGWAGMYDLIGVIGVTSDAPYGPHIEALPDGGFLYPALIEKSVDALKYLKTQLKILLGGA